MSLTFRGPARQGPTWSPAHIGIDALVRLITRTDNLAAHRFFGMGFALGPADVVPVEHMTAVTNGVVHPLIRVPFRCVCGREEIFSGYVPEAQQRFNIFLQLEAIGSLSRQHLLEDGYSVAQIDAMERELDVYMLAVGFERPAPLAAFGRTASLEAYGDQWKNHPLRYDLPAGDSRWVWRTDRVPPVPGLAEDFAVRDMRQGTYTGLAQRSESLERGQRAWYEVPGPVRYPSVSRVSRTLRVGATLDSEE